jgi:iron-sulfur cluster assembly accessory protein
MHLVCNETGKQKSYFVKAGYFIYLILSKDSDMETTTALPVTLTASAKDEIKRLMNEPGFNFNQSLRIGVKGGGCSGMTYVLGFDLKSEKDESFNIDGIDIIMEKSHGIYLMGMEVDWQGGLNSRGFTFNNPNASKTCGCGTSFAV